MVEIKGDLLRKVQLIQVEMLKDLIKVFEENNIKYFALYGTVLGAVRHKGFIPWDDDIDLGIPREDYDRFLEIAPKCLPKDLFLQTIFSEKEYYLPFAKVRKNNTTFLEASTKNDNIHHGIFIDIFPLDYAPNDVSLHRAKCRKFKYYLIKMSKYCVLDEHFIKKIVRKLICNLSFHNVKYYSFKADKLCRNSVKSNLYVDYAGGEGSRSIMPIEWFGNGIKLRFEDIDLVVPEKYEEYLVKLYNDFMMLPPLENRNSGHTVLEIDF